MDSTPHKEIKVLEMDLWNHRDRQATYFSRSTLLVKPMAALEQTTIFSSDW